MLKDKLIDCRDMFKTHPEFADLEASIDLNKTIETLSFPFAAHIKHYVPEHLKQQLQTLPLSLRALAQKYIIIQCALDNMGKVNSNFYSLNIEQQYHKALTRIVDTSLSEQGWAEVDEDVYWKELAIARHMMFPVCGARIVENTSGFGFKQGLNKGLLQSIRYTWLNLLQGGCKNYYQVHIHTPAIAEFTPEGWNQCYLQVAEMLERYPDVKGVFGGSWYYDPQLKNISPHLMYLQDTQLQNGASSFHIGDDDSNSALISSKTRRRLFEQGKYKPQVHLVIWPRKALLKWAKEFRLQNNFNTVSMENR